MLTQKIPNIYRTGRPTKFKLGTQTEHKDPYQRQAPWPSRSKVKVARSRDASDRCWPISRERNVIETPKWEDYPRTHGQQCLQVSRSNVKVTWSITLHNNTSFRTTIAFYSHSIGGDTSTITLPPRFIIIRYSLGGDTDKSDTALVRTLWVHSSSFFSYVADKQTDKQTNRGFRAGVGKDKYISIVQSNYELLCCTMNFGCRLYFYLSFFENDVLMSSLWHRFVQTESKEEW